MKLIRLNGGREYVVKTPAGKKMGLAKIRGAAVFRVGFCLIAWLLTAGAMAAERPAVLAVRAADHDGVTRIVLEVTGPISFQQADSSDPRQLDIALPELDWRADTASALGHG